MKKIYVEIIGIEKVSLIERECLSPLELRAALHECLSPKMNIDQFKIEKDNFID